MPPLDDELRAALQGRAATLTPPADPFAGVERRARGMRRRRTAASVAGTALAVLAVVGVVPLVTSPGGSAPGVVATSAPSPAASRYALDHDDPWEYRGDPSLVTGSELAVLRAELAATRGVRAEQVALDPLYGSVDEPSGSSVVVFVAAVLRDGRREAPVWGVAQSSEAGPVLSSAPLRDGTGLLVAALPDDEVPRLLVVGDPGLGGVEYGPDGPDGWVPAQEREPGVFVLPREGTPGADRVRSVGPDGAQVDLVPAEPEVRVTAPAGRAEEDEGPGTQTPVEVDDAAYALDLDDPWAYRGPAELTRHPGLGTDATRLFSASRGTGWSERPLYAVELEDDLSVLVTLHRRAGRAEVSTTWRRGSAPAQQAALPVQEGALLLQGFVPAVEGGLLVALAHPSTGAVETSVPDAVRLLGEESEAVWRLPADPDRGEVFLYAPGDGLQFHSEPARRS